MRALAQFMLPIAVLATVLSFGDTPAEPSQGARLAMTSGGVSLENSRNGTAIFNVGNLGPGDSGGGQVTLSNSGTSSGDLKLSQADVVDTPGPLGGRLSGAVQLSVLDVGNGNSTVYSGALSGLGERALGRLAPGQSRTYSFVITLPDGGAPPTPTGGDNVFRGSTITARYQWDLVEVAGTGGGSGTGGGAGSGVVSDGIDWDTTGWVGNSSMRMQGRMSVKLALKKGIINVYLRCSEPCRLRASAGLVKRSQLNARRRSLNSSVATKRVAISLKLSKKALKALRGRVAKKGKDYLWVKIQATDPRGGSLTMNKKKLITGKKR